MNATKWSQLFLATAVLLSLPGICQAAWNIDKARQIGEDAISGPSAQDFDNDFQKAKFIMGQLGEALAQNRVAPNGTITGRVGAVLMSGTADQGKCQWCAETLREALKSAGVPPKNMFIVYGDVRAFSGSDININRSHAALAVVVNGRVVIYDLWKHGMEKETFSGAGESKWNNLSLPQWVVGLDNYEYFGFNSEFIDSTRTALSESFQRELLAAWEKINKPKKQEPPQPKTGTKRLRSGAYTVSRRIRSYA